MNTWVRSITAGAATTALVVLLVNAFIKNKQLAGNQQLYQARYLVSMHADSLAGLSPAEALNTAIIAIGRRFASAGYSFDGRPGKENRLEIAAANINDTILAARILTGKGALEFREVYTLKEMTAGFVAAEKIIGTYIPVKTKKPAADTVDDSDSLSPLKRLKPADDYDEPPPSIGMLIRFMQPYQQESGGMQYPPALGMMRTADTALIWKILHDPGVLQALPHDSRFYYGVAEKTGDGKEMCYLYAIRTRNQPADIGNNAIKRATPDISMNGKPEITFEFKPAAARKWARMTAANIGQPIAIIFDEKVISAPIVNSAIEGGSSAISGYFTMQEARVLAAQLSGDKLPADLTIISSKITPQKQGTRIKYLLFITIVFVILSLLAFFIFKTLKNRQNRL